VHAGQGVNRGGAADNQHERNENIGGQTENEEDEVGKGAVAGLDNLEVRVGVGSTPLELDGEGCEEQDLDGGASGVPEGTRDAVSVADAGALKEGGGPCPRRHDGGCDQP
jgi:hypothetical protein